MRLYSTPISIVSDRYARFTVVQGIPLGNGYRVEVWYYIPSSDRWTVVIQILEDLLKSCIPDWQSSWEDHLPLVEFANNNSYQSTMGTRPFDALYDRPCCSQSCWLDNRDQVLVGPKMIEDAVNILNLIKKTMKEAQYRHKSYVDLHRST